MFLQVILSAPSSGPLHGVRQASVSVSFFSNLVFFLFLKQVPVAVLSSSPLMLSLCS